jgi:hypothetical protein
MGILYTYDDPSGATYLGAYGRTNQTQLNFPEDAGQAMVITWISIADWQAGKTPIRATPVDFPLALVPQNIDITDAVRAAVDQTCLLLPAEFPGAVIVVDPPDPVGPVNLLTYQLNLCAMVDVETQRRIAQGFEYPAASGLLFSLSLESQINILGLIVFGGSLAFPILVRTIDNVGSYSIVDLADSQQFAGTAVAVKDALIQGGRNVKTAVLATVDVAGADAAAAAWLAGL